MISLDTIRARQPRWLLRNDAFRAIPPEDLGPADLDELASPSVVTDPAKVLSVFRKHVEQDTPELAVLIRAFTQLGFLFDPNSFFSSADRQILRSHKDFRRLAHDLTKARNEIPEAAAPVLLYSMACLDYRCAPLLPQLLSAAETNVKEWRTDVLSLLLHSVVSLGIFGKDPVVFELLGGQASKDFRGLAEVLARELGERAGAWSAAGASGEDGVSSQDWARAAFSMVTADILDLTATPPGGVETAILPLLVSKACEGIEDVETLDNSGWAQFFLYQTIYCVDVLKPQCEEPVKRAVPMWMQERLHERWLNDIVLLAQPQGADNMQRDVDAAFRRTNTQALLNCSVGREWDEQHCWFAGFLLEPKVAVECDSLLPLKPGEPLASGWLQLKSRLLRKMGYQVVTLHSCFWDKLSEDQKDEQIVRLRRAVGYQHDHRREKELKKIRQTPHTYKGVERKKSDWTTLPSPPADNETSSDPRAPTPPPA